jgi:hypothetical protein
VHVSHFLSCCSCSCTRWRQRRPTTLSCWLLCLANAWCSSTSSGRCLLGHDTNREALWLSSRASCTGSRGRWQKERGRRGAADAEDVVVVRGRGSCLGSGRLGSGMWFAVVGGRPKRIWCAEPRTQRDAFLVRV